MLTILIFGAKVDISIPYCFLLGLGKGKWQMTEWKRMKSFGLNPNSFTYLVWPRLVHLTCFTKARSLCRVKAPCLVDSEVVLHIWLDGQMYKQKTHQERITQEQKHFENDDRKKKAYHLSHGKEMWEVRVWETVGSSPLSSDLSILSKRLAVFQFSKWDPQTVCCLLNGGNQYETRHF